MKLRYFTYSLLALLMVGTLPSCKKDEPHKGNEKDWSQEVAGVYWGWLVGNIGSDKEWRRPKKLEVKSLPGKPRQIQLVLHGDPVYRFILHQQASDFAGATYDLKQPLQFLLPYTPFVEGKFDVTSCQQAYYSYKKQALNIEFTLKSRDVTGTLSFITDPEAKRYYY